MKVKIADPRARSPLDAALYGPRTVVEIGAHSLKIHRHQCGNFHTVKYPYHLGHEVYSGRKILNGTARRIVEVTPAHILPPAVGIATSAVRDAANRTSFVRTLSAELEFGIHVLSHWEETALLAEGYLGASKHVPALVADIGGGSLELVYLSRSQKILWDSLPLGAIRLYQQGLRAGLEGQLELIQSGFEKAAVVRAGEIWATGGTASAIAKTTGKNTVEREEVVVLEERTRRQGPPIVLRPERARVFHAGLILMLKLFELAGADRLHYIKISIGRVFLSVAGRSVRSWVN